MRHTLGEDSDEFRVRVMGLPPRTDVEQFISRDMVQRAMERTVPVYKRWPLILGCDVGRGDRSVMLPRRGRVVLPKVEILHGERTMDFARRIAEEIRFYRSEEGLEAQAIIEELGMGVGVVESLEDMGYAENVWGINTGVSASEPELYSNLRCEMWALGKEWLEGEVELPNIPELHDDLASVKRKPNANGKLRLETKEEMRRRGLKSPDVGDAWALTLPFRSTCSRIDRGEATAGAKTNWRPPAAAAPGRVIEGRMMDTELNPGPKRKSRRRRSRSRPGHTRWPTRTWSRRSDLDQGGGQRSNQDRSRSARKNGNTSPAISGRRRMSTR
jgi:hypothetical protein